MKRTLEEHKANKAKLERAFVFDATIDQKTYREMRSQLLEEIAVAEMEFREVTADTLDVDAVLDFAESVLLNASNLWIAADLQQSSVCSRFCFRRVWSTKTVVIEPLQPVCYSMT